VGDTAAWPSIPFAPFPDGTPRCAASRRGAQRSVAILPPSMACSAGSAAEETSRHCLSGRGGPVASTASCRHRSRPSVVGGEHGTEQQARWRRWVRRGRSASRHPTSLGVPGRFILGHGLPARGFRHLAVVLLLPPHPERSKQFGFQSVLLQLSQVLNGKVLGADLTANLARV